MPKLQTQYEIKDVKPETQGMEWYNFWGTKQQEKILNKLRWSDLEW